MSVDLLLSWHQSYMATQSAIATQEKTDSVDKVARDSLATPGTTSTAVAPLSPSRVDAISSTTTNRSPIIPPPIDVDLANAALSPEEEAINTTLDRLGQRLLTRITDHPEIWAHRRLTYQFSRNEMIAALRTAMGIEPAVETWWEGKRIHKVPITDEIHFAVDAVMTAIAKRRKDEDGYPCLALHDNIVKSVRAHIKLKPLLDYDPSSNNTSLSESRKGLVNLDNDPLPNKTGRPRSPPSDSDFDFDFDYSGEYDSDG